MAWGYPKIAVIGGRCDALCFHSFHSGPFRPLVIAIHYFVLVGYARLKGGDKQRDGRYPAAAHAACFTVQ